MTSNYHTPLSVGAALTQAVMEAPLGALDAQITQNTTDIAAAAATATNIFNPLTYGALGDDSHDDTTAIQAAVTAALVGKGKVFIPPGTYKITAAISIPSPLTIEGGGGWDGQTIIHQVTANTAALDFGSGSDGSILIGVKVTGPTGNASGAGIYARKTVHMKDVWVLNFYDGIDISASGTYYGYLETVFVQNAVNIGFHVESGAYNLTLVHPKAHGCATGLSAVSYTSLRIFGGSFEQCTTRGIEATGTISRSILVDGTYFESAVGTEDIRLGGAATLDTAVITNCVFADNTVASYWHVNAFGVTRLSLIGNKIGSSGAGGGSLQTAATTSSLLDLHNIFSGTVTVNAATKRLLWDGTTLTSPATATGTLTASSTRPGMAAFHFAFTTALAGTGTVDIPLADAAAAITAVRAPWAGSIVGISISLSAARTAGTVTANARNIGAGTDFSGLTVTLDGTTTNNKKAVTAVGTANATFNADDRIGVRLTTSGWTPTAVTGVVVLWVVYDAVG